MRSPPRGQDGASRSAEQDCLNNAVVASNTQGWCHVDADPVKGEPRLVIGCLPTARRKLRCVGQGQIEPRGATFLVCTGARL